MRGRRAIRHWRMGVHRAGQMCRLQAGAWPATGKSHRRIAECAGLDSEQVDVAWSLLLSAIAVAIRDRNLRKCRLGQSQCRCPVFRHDLGHRMVLPWRTGADLVGCFGRNKKWCSKLSPGWALVCYPCKSLQG